MNANSNVNVAARNPHTGQIMFRAGQMLQFVATRPFTLGQTGIQIREGTEILYDGSKAIVDGAEHVVPFLRGAMKAGWIVLLEEYDPEGTNYNTPTRANIQVRHATQGGNPLNPTQRMAIATTESDEREVGTVRNHAQNTRTANTQFVRGKTAVNVVAPGTKVQTQHGMMVIEEQDGIEVGRTLKTPAGSRAKNTRTELTSDKAAEALRQAQNVQIEPGQGISQEEMLSRMTEEQRAEYLAMKESYRSQYVSEPAPTPVKAPSGRKAIASVQSTKEGESSGMRFTNSYGGGTEISDGDGDLVGKVGGSDEVAAVEEDGIKFTTTNGPKRDRKKAGPADTGRTLQTYEMSSSGSSTMMKKVAGPSADVRRQVAKAICQDFPDSYDFTLSTKKKLARIVADFEDRADVLRAIFAAEDDEMKSLLVAEFPAVFGG